MLMINNSFVFSQDTPEGSGDHENFFGIDPKKLTIHERDGTRYGDCNKLAVNIREIGTHIPWHSSKNNVIFSDLSNEFIIVNETNLEDAKNSINYTKAVKSTYG